MIYLQNLLSNPVETISLTAIIDTALCVGAGGSSGSLADKPIVRTADHRLLIPASQIKGRLRHECEKLARGLRWKICQSPVAQNMCPQRAGLSEAETQYFEQQYQIDSEDQYHCLICQIFGNPVLPSRVLFDDLICQKKPENLPSEVLRPGVTINRRRRTAEEKKLYFLETSPVNTELSFQGGIHLLPSCPQQGKALILVGLQHIHALGGSKSAGLGWLKWKFDEEKVTVNEDAWQALLPRGKS